MKKIIKQLTLLSIALGLLTSCNEDDNTGASLMNNYSPVTVNIVASSNNVMVMETAGEQSFMVTASVTDPQPIDIVIDLKQIGGTANADDFETSVITIPSGLTSATGNITILQTGDLEGDETLEIKAFPRANAEAPFTFNATITSDYVNDNLDLSLAWAGSYVYDINALGAEVSIDYCAADFDLLLFDGSFGYLGYVLGTGSCPEPTESLSGLADGTYYLVADLWDNPFSGLGTGQPLPLTLTYSQDYFPMTAGTIVNNGYTTDSSSGLVGIAKVEVLNGYEYTVTPF